MGDLLVTGGKVFTGNGRLVECAVKITDGRITDIGKSLKNSDGLSVVDAKGKVVIPGLVETHFHPGLYRPLDADAKSESASAVAGGVTTTLNYFRTGKNYLNTSEKYGLLMPRLLELSKGNFYTDYGFNLAPVTREHVDEIPDLVSKFGISTFKYYMFFRSQKLNLKGETPAEKEEPYLLTSDTYDFGHLVRIMKRIASLDRPGIRLSIHAEDPEIIRESSEYVRENANDAFRDLTDLEKYSEARPPLAESTGIIQAVWLAKELSCPINILHISSKEGVDALRFARRHLPEVDISVEVTASHLTLDSSSDVGSLAKIHPPIRSKEHQEALWSGIRDGTINTVASDHCALDRERKKGDIWSAESAFGNVEIMLSTILSNGYHRRGIPLDKLIPMVTQNPADKFGLSGRKGRIDVGMDGDLVVVDLSRERTVTLSEMHSSQDFTPFEGLVMKGIPEKTILRGEVVYDDGEVIGSPAGKFLSRPL